MFEMCIVILKSRYSLYDQQYYLSLDGENCVENEITYCLYAFETSQEIEFNSIDTYLYIGSKDKITRCGQCQDKYTYNIEANKCQPSKLTDGCYYSYLPTQASLDEVCLFGPKLNRNNDPVSFVTQSFCLNSNCHICLISEINIKVSYICLECNNGYYAEKLSGFCLPCPSELNCQVCYQQNQISKDNWKNQIRAFIDQSQIVTIKDILLQLISNVLNYIERALSKSIEDYEIVCKFCLDGYELHNGKCIKQCPQSCLKCKIINDENICIQCPLIQVKRSLSLQDNQCIQCPGSCVFCLIRQQDEIQQINPLFNNYNFSYFSNQCLQQQQGHYDTDLKIYVDCPSLACMKEMQIILNLHCSREQYDQQIQSLQNEEDVRSFNQTNILIDDLFSASSFQQVNFSITFLVRVTIILQLNSVFFLYQMTNEKLIRTISIKIVSLQQQTCIIKNNKSIQQQFSKNIFSAINVQLELQGNGNTIKPIDIVHYTIFQYDKIISIVNFKKVIIQGIILQQLPVQNLKQLLFNSVFEQEIKLLDIRYKSNLIQDQSQILIQNSTINC